MILFFTILINLSSSLSCEQELKKVIDENVIKRVDSYAEKGTGLDWFDSFNECKEKKESMYSAILWKLNSATKVTYGFCIPENCNQTISEQVLSNLLQDNRLKKIESDEVSFVLFDFIGVSEMNFAGKLFVNCFNILMIFSVLFSFISLFLRKESFMNHFSVFSNFWKFLANPNDFGNLQFFDGIRSICSVSLVFFHGFFMLIYIPMRNRAEFNSLFSSFSFTLVVSIQLIVDVFFFMSGFLMSFLTIQELRKKQKDFKWFSFLLKRLLRYLPAYFFVIGLERSSAGGKPASIGSVIPYVTTLNVAKDWWGSLIMIHHLLSDKDVNYLSWTWSVACDFQFYIICSFILYLYNRRKTYGYSAAFTLLLASILYTGLVSYYYDFSPSTVKSILDLPQLNTIYVRPFPRIGTFIIGLIFGLVYLEMNRKHHGKESHAYEFQNGFGDYFEASFERLIKNDLFIKIFYPTAILILTWIIAGPYYLDYYGETSLHVGLKAIWLALKRPVFVIVVGILMLIIALGHLPAVSWFLSMRIFQYFSKISYCFYMIHCMVFGAIFMNGSEYIDGSFQTWFSMSCSTLWYSIFIALILEILVQMPFIGLGGRFLR